MATATRLATAATALLMPDATPVWCPGTALMTVVVRGATVTVSSHRGHLEVEVETRDDVAANVALGRARDLVGSRTAGR